MRKNGVFAALLALVMLVGAAPATQTGGGTLHEVVPAQLQVMDALLKGDARGALVAALSAIGGDERAIAAMAEGGMAEQLLPVADLDGDDLPDVLGLARAPEPAQSDERPAELTVTAHSGLGGTPLWSHTVSGVAGVPVATPGGFVLVTAQPVGAAILIHLTAFDSDGTVRWERTDAGVVGSTAVQWPTYVGALRQPDGSVQHLIQSVTYSFIQQNMVEPGALVATVLSDADGEELHELERSGDGVPWAHAAPDLDGDGADDVLLTQSYVFGERGEVVATKVDGTELWTATAPFRSNGFVVRPGDVNDDGVPDVALGTGGSAVGLLSGADGSTLWEMPGAWPAALGDVDGDSTPDVGVRTIGGSYSDFTTTHAAYDGTGRQLYRTNTILPLDPMSGYQATTTTHLITADVDGDGIQDTFHEFELVYDNGERVHDAAATSGRDGRAIWSDRLPLSLGDSVQGPGVDFARVQSNGSQAFVEVLRGDTLARIWRTPVPAAGAMTSASAAAADLNGDGYGDVLVSVVTSGTAGSRVQHGFVLDGRDAARLW